MSSTHRHVVPREEPWPTESWKWKQERVLLPPTPQTTDASLPGETHLLLATKAAASHLHIQKSVLTDKKIIRGVKIAVQTLF